MGASMGVDLHRQNDSGRQPCKSMVTGAGAMEESGDGKMRELGAAVEK